MKRRKADPVAPTVEFSAGLPGLAELYPIEPMTKFIPEWWRKMSRDREQQEPWTAGTVKTCPAILDVLLSGWVMPTPCDVAFSSPNPFELMWTVGPNAPRLAEHELDQIPGMPCPDGWHSKPMKFGNMWAAKTPPGYSLRVGNVPLDFDPPFDVFPAIVDTDYHHHLIPVFRYRWMGRGEKFVPAGTPFAHLTLVRREDEQMKSVVTREERFAELTRTAMGAVSYGRRLIRGAYKNEGKLWKQRNGVRY